MKVIFLDVDGVLNDNHTTDRFFSEKEQRKYIGIDTDKVERLNKIVLATKAKIVLSSSWRKHSNFVDYLNSKLKEVDPLLPDKIIDVTPVHFSHCLRASEIEEYLDMRAKKLKITKFIILDDMQYDDLERFGESFFLTGWDKGLSEEIMSKCISFLNKRNKRTKVC